MEGKMKWNVPEVIVSSSDFHTTERYLRKDFEVSKSIDKQIELNENKRKEHVIIKGIAHLNQCDLAIL
jgi:hypothetical protein